MLDRSDACHLSGDAPAFCLRCRKAGAACSHGGTPQMDFGAFQLQNLFNEPESILTNLW